MPDNKGVINHIILQYKRHARNRNIEWYDFGVPINPYKYNNENVKAHMQCCNTICHLINNNKFYYCGIAWAAYESGLYDKMDGYIDLQNIDKRDLEDKKNILECCLGNVENGYLQFCKKCGGFGNDNNNKVTTAKQFICNLGEK